MRTINRSKDNEESLAINPATGHSQLTKKEVLATQFAHTLAKSNPMRKFSAAIDYGHLIGAQAVAMAEAVLGDRAPEEDDTISGPELEDSEPE